MSTIPSVYYCNVSSSSSNRSGEAETPKNHRLFTWGTAAISVGILAIGGFLAMYPWSAPDESNTEENTTLVARVTSLTQDAALFVSGGIMPFLGLLGASLNVFRQEQIGHLESFSEDKIKEKIMEAIETENFDELKELVRKNYRAGCIDSVMALMLWIPENDDRDDLCEKLAKESYQAGRLDEAERFIELMSRRMNLCIELAKESYQAGRFDEAERFIQLIHEEDDRNIAFSQLAKRSSLENRFNEAEKFIKLMTESLERDFICKDMAEKSYWAGHSDKAEKFVKLMSKGLIRLIVCENLAKNSYNADCFDETLKFIHLMEDEFVEGFSLLNYAVHFFKKDQMDKAATFINLLPDSYDAFKYVNIDIFTAECIKACEFELRGVQSDKSLEELTQEKYLKFIHSIPNRSLRELLLWKAKDMRTPVLVPDCMDSENCPVVDLNLVPTRAIEAVSFPSIIQAISDGWERRESSRNTDFEMLRFRGDDPRKKALFAVAAADHNGALHPFYDERILRILDSRYDLKYQIVSNEESLCKAIRSGAEKGELVRIYIHAHGFSTFMQLGNKAHEIIDRSSNFSSCFSDLPSDLIVVLPGCLTGGPTLDGSDNLAQTIADKTQKTVIAAREVTQVMFKIDYLKGKKILMHPISTFSDSEEFFHPSQSDATKNIFLTFNPRK
jgi:hypothetical protein